MCVCVYIKFIYVYVIIYKYRLCIHMKHLHPKQNNLKVLKEWFSINKSTFWGPVVEFHCILEQERLDSKCPVNFFFSLKARSAEAGAGAEVFFTFLILDANILQKLLFLFSIIKHLSEVCHRKL